MSDDSRPSFHSPLGDVADLLSPQVCGTGLRPKGINIDLTVPLEEFDKPEYSVLLEAHSLVTGPRSKAYGTPQDNFSRWRNLAQASGRPGLADISAEDIAVLMILGKIARDTNVPKNDNIVDVAGYAHCWEQVRGL